MVDELGEQDDASSSAPPQPQMGGGLSGQAGISGGQGIFHGLISTMMQGLVARAAQGGKAALAQRNETPYARSMAAGINAPQKQQQQMDEQTERQMRMALTKVNYLQSLHALTKADQETQIEAHDTFRNYVQDLAKQHKVEWMGGTSPDRAALAQDARKYSQMFPNDQVLVAPVGYSTHGSPVWGIAHIKSDPLAETANYKFGGHDESGLPPKSITVTKGTPANDSTTQVVGGMKDALVASEVSKDNGPVPAPLLQTSPEQLRQEMLARHIPVPANLDELWSVAQGEQDFSKLDKSSKWEDSSPVIGQDRAQNFIRHNFDSDFDPSKAATQGEMRKTLEAYLKPGGMKDDKVDEALETSDQVLGDASSSTAEKQIARKVKAAAADEKAANPMSKNAFEATMTKLAGENLLAPDAATDSRKVIAAINKSKVLTADEKNKAIAHLISTPTPASSGAAQAIRMEILGNLREMPSIDTANGGALAWAPPTLINANPGRFTPAGPGMQAAGKEAIFSDIHQNINKAKDAFGALESLDQATRLRLVVALRQNDSSATISNIISGSAVGDDPKVQDAAIAIASLKENAMALRGVANMGSGSDELRDAIAATLPTGKAVSKGFALKQLAQFEAVVNRLEKGVPRSGMPGLHVSPRVQKFLGPDGIGRPGLTRDQQLQFINNSHKLTNDEKKEALEQLAPTNNSPATSK